MTIYELGIGDDLVDPPKKNRIIYHYLQEEKALVERSIAPFDYVLEIGCTYGRYARIVGGGNKCYLGIDIVASYIEKARLAHSSLDTKVRFLCSDAAQLRTILDHEVPHGRQILIVFPFNVFGILELEKTFWEDVKSRNLKLAIYTFDISAKALRARCRYYKSAGFENPEIVEAEAGIRFVHQRGLNSIAYSEAWLSQVFRKNSQFFRAEAFAGIGKAYYNF